MSEQKDDREPPGNGAILGVLFAVALTVGAIYLVERMRHSASLFDCAFTHAPKCRELIQD
ncbi:hypothetical protein [uncultured Enterovirga sp.]|uniref:hypothetical protein n=1 Tax=uncultured Enterovirga sp. TaxID=2026352 RepID=UPI0035C950E4